MSLQIFGLRHHPCLPILASVILGVAVPAQAEADPVPPPAGPPAVSEAEVLIDSGANEGRIAINAAAGNNNQQANVAAIALGGTGQSQGAVAQHLTALGPPASGASRAGIAENAFAGSSGMIAVNVAAGSENQQVNLALIAIGIEGVAITDAMLSQTRGSQTPVLAADENAQPQRIAEIGADAFAGATGLVQVNLIGGERNSSANIFALSVAAGVN